MILVKPYKCPKCNHQTDLYWNGTNYEGTCGKCFSGILLNPEGDEEELQKEVDEWDVI